MRNSWNEEFLKRGISWNEENPETRNFLKRGKSSNEDDMVCKKSLPAVKCEHPGRKRSHRSNLHISNMDILQKKWFKSLIPARNRRSNILLHTLKGYHRLLNWHCQLSRAINYTFRGVEEIRRVSSDHLSELSQGQVLVTCGRKSNSKHCAGHIIYILTW